jgi:hypothetical protein
MNTTVRIILAKMFFEASVLCHCFSSLFANCAGDNYIESYNYLLFFCRVGHLCPEK